MRQSLDSFSGGECFRLTLSPWQGMVSHTSEDAAVAAIRA